MHARLPMADRRWATEVDLIAQSGVACRTTPATVIQAVELITTLLVLPEIPAVPSEGAPGATGIGDTQPADRRRAVVLERVRGLLRKAESTTFEAEAEALTAKAQQLITRHAIDEVLLGVGAPDTGGGPGVHRILLDDPYLSAKSVLVHVVASANRCRSVFSRDLGWCTVVGFPDDLAAVELLVASLLTQATAAMGRLGSQRDRAGRVRTRSFRRAFLEGFAVRIGQRLQTVGEQTLAQTQDGQSALPVLASRALAVQQATDELFSRTHRMRSRPVDPRGWAAGAAAADLAALDTAAGRLRDAG